MKTVLCTLAASMLLAATFFTTQTLVREEGKRTRNAFTKALSETHAETPEPADALANRLDALNTQLANLNRRMTALEEAVASSTAKDDGATKSMRTDLAALRQDMKELSSAQARFNVVPGYLADLTRYLDQSFAHVEKIVSGNAMPDAFAASIDELAQRLDMIEGFFVPLYEALGLAQDTETTGVSSMGVQLDILAEQVDFIRQNIDYLLEWFPPRNATPAQRTR